MTLIGHHSVSFGVGIGQSTLGRGGAYIGSGPCSTFGSDVDDRRARGPNTVTLLDIVQDRHRKFPV